MKNTFVIFLLLTFIIHHSQIYGQLISERFASYSPDKQRIAFESNRNGKLPAIIIYDLNSGQFNQITSNDFVSGSPKWSPDGKKVAYYSNQGDSIFTNFDIYTYDISTERHLKLTEYPGMDMMPIWSNDGKKIFYNSNRETEQLRCINVEAKQDSLLFLDIEHHNPISIDDGSTKFLSIINEEGNWDVTVRSLEDGSILKRLSLSSRELEPQWGAKENIIYYSSNKEGYWRIYRHDLSKELENAITPEDKSCRFFDFYSEDNSMIFSMQEEGNLRLYTLSANEVLTRLFED